MSKLKKATALITILFVFACNKSEEKKPESVPAQSSPTTNNAACPQPCSSPEWKNYWDKCRQELDGIKTQLDECKAVTDSLEAISLFDNIKVYLSPEDEDASKTRKINTGDSLKVWKRYSTDDGTVFFEISHPDSKYPMGWAKGTDVFLFSEGQTFQHFQSSTATSLQEYGSNYNTDSALATLKSVEFRERIKKHYPEAVKPEVEE